MIAAHQKPDIVNLLFSEGVELKQKGRNLWAKCPFHEEKTASFKVDPERQVFHAFCCGEHGDVIRFIQKTRGLSFPDSLRYLGISGNLQYKPDPVEQRKKELYSNFEEWCQAYYIGLCNRLIRIGKIKKTLRTEAEVEAYAWAYHEESKWELHADILITNDLDAKLILYREVSNG